MISTTTRLEAAEMARRFSNNTDHEVRRLGERLWQALQVEAFPQSYTSEARELADSIIAGGKDAKVMTLVELTNKLHELEVEGKYFA